VGPFLRAFDRDTFEREKLLLLRGSASLKSSMYLSIFITARRSLLLHLRPLSLCHALLSLFFFSSLPPYFSGLPLRADSPFRRSVSRARARRYRFDTQYLRAFSRTRADRIRGASTSIFLRFIAARLRNASNAVHAA